MVRAPIVKKSTAVFSAAARLLIGLSLALPMPARAAFDFCSLILGQEQHRLAEFWRIQRELPKVIRRGRPTLVVLHGVSSGKNYSKRAKELVPGINVLHQSGEHLPLSMLQNFGFEPRDYQLALTHNGTEVDFNQLVEGYQTLQADGIHFVAGEETAVPLADKLEYALNPGATSPEVSQLVRDKEKMAAAVAPEVQTIPGKTFSDAEKAIAWLEEQGLEFPVFVKPPASSASFGGRLVDSEKDLHAFFQSTLVRGQKDPLGTPIDRLLVQKNMFGPKTREFVVDGVVDEEFGFVPTDYLRYRKRLVDGRMVYEGVEAFRFDPRLKFHNALLSQAQKVARRVKRKSGPLHMEFLVEDHERFSSLNQITFVETAGRAAGGGIPQFIRACGGNDQITMHLLQLFDRKEFRNRVAQGPVLETEGLQIDLRGPSKPGVLVDWMSEEQLKQRIPGIINVDLHLKRGQYFSPATNLFNAPGVINVKGTPDEIEKAYETVRKLEASGLYTMRSVRWYDYVRFARERALGW